MGAWSTSITGNDTAKDLYTEYTCAFFRYDTEEALQRIDTYIRTEMFDETDEEEWCNYYYSLADFMHKKGILTDKVRDTAIKMIDSGFGLSVWEEAGEKTLLSRKKVLSEFREKLVSPLPPRKKIKPNAHLEKIFNEGDIVAIRLQTKDKPYTKDSYSPMPLEDFHALDGKYILIQLVKCNASWSSSIVPEIKDYWAIFRLFDGIYDTIPENIDFSELKDAHISESSPISSGFCCESSMFHFKKRDYKVLANRKDLLDNFGETNCSHHIFLGINKPWFNPDSIFVSAMGKQVVCGDFKGGREQLLEICRRAVGYGRYDYSISKEENDRIFAEMAKAAADEAEAVAADGGRIVGLSFGREIGFAAIRGEQIASIFIYGMFQRNGFGTVLLKYAAFCIGENAYIDIPADNKAIRRVCEKAGFVQDGSTIYGNIRMIKE